MITNVVNIQETTITIENKWEEFKELFQKIKIDYLKLGQIACYLYDNDANPMDKFRTYGLEPSFVRNLLKVGRGTLLPELFERPRFEKFPLEHQKVIITGKVLETVLNNHGVYEERIVDLLRAESATINQVLAKDHIRTKDEQIRYLRSKEAPVRVEHACDSPWKVDGNKVFFKRDTVLTKQEVKTLYNILFKSKKG